jgi:hypothetical protein
MDMATVALY